MPMFRSATPQVGLTGTMAKATSSELKAIIGARVKIILSENGGIQSSLKNILIMSAPSWNAPTGAHAVRSVAVLAQAEQTTFDQSSAARRR